MSRIIFTENERIIIRLLRKNRSLSKAMIAESGGMSWATVVKMTNRLKNRGTIAVAGSGENKKKPGKKELLYTLSPDAFLAVGVDVEYSRTRLILADLRGNVLLAREHGTPQNPSVGSLQAFLVDALKSFLEEMGDKKPHVVGIGIGLPGVVIPAWLKPDDKENRKSLRDFLQTSTGIPVVIEINARSSTNWLKWNNPFFPGEDFIFISIRTGVGMGIIFRGELFIGHRFISGEIGHIKVSSKNRPCRCGGKGCLETLINQNALYREYSEIVPGMAEGPVAADTILSGLEDLFTRARRGEKPARGILTRAAEYLGNALSSSLMTVYIPNIIIGGHFGKDGDVFLPMVEKVLEKKLLPSMRVNLRYLPIEKVPFAEGDALLAVNEYLGNNLGTEKPMAAGGQG